MHYVLNNTMQFYVNNESKAVFSQTKSDRVAVIIFTGSATIVLLLLPEAYESIFQLGRTYLKK